MNLKTKINQVPMHNSLKRLCLILAIYCFLAMSNATLLDLSSLNATQGLLLSHSTYHILIKNGINMGDLNGDKIDDVVLSFEPYTLSIEPNGFYVLYGSDNRQTFEIDIALAKSVPNQGFFIYNSEIRLGGRAVNGGDINGDGVNDIIIINPYPNDFEVMALVVYIKKDSTLDIDVNEQYFTSEHGFLIHDPSRTRSSSLSASRAGDINNDGIDDIIIGDYIKNDQRGMAYVIYGSKSPIQDIDVDSASFSPNQGFRIWGPDSTKSDFFGNSVSYAGDVNGDNIDDVIINALPTDSPLGAAYKKFGAVYVIFGSNRPISDIDVGSSDFAPNQGFKIVHSRKFQNSWFSDKLMSAGDMNGDNIDDIIITDELYNRSGAVFVIYGTKSPVTEIDIDSTTFSPNQGFKVWNSVGLPREFGRCIEIIDMNGDGLNDIIIGEGQSNPLGGSVYVIYGTRDSRGDLDVKQGNFSSEFGFRIWESSGQSPIGFDIGNAGDVNGDGVSDLMIKNVNISNLYRMGSYVVYGNGGQCIRTLSLLFLFLFVIFFMG